MLWFLLKYGCILYVVYHLLCYIGYRIKKTAKEIKYASIAKKKRAFRDEQLKKSVPRHHLLPDLVDKVLEASIPQLTHMLNNNEVTSVDVLLVYYERARTLGVDYECATEFLMDEALETARKCDDIRSKMFDKNHLGLLFGIPISIKDNITQKGADSTCGLASRCFNPEMVDGLIVEILKFHGAIPFVRGNVPQGLLTIESVNNIFGRAKNPYDLTRSCGGSSGGDAGLAALRCAALGIGTDLGGSIRLPASFCGVYAFKPTARRGTTSGSVFANKHNKEPYSVLKRSICPIGRCVDDLVLATRVLLSPEISRKDPVVTPLPFDMGRFDIEQKKAFRIGYIMTDQFLPVSRANKRAVFEAINALTAAGHEVIDVTAFSIAPLALNYFSIMSSEGGLKSLISALDGEKMLKEYELNYMMNTLPTFIRKHFVPRLLDFLGETRLATISRVSGGKDAGEFFTQVQSMQQNQEAFFKMWDSNKLDALLLPATATPAFPHGKSSSLVLSIMYASLGNILDLPTGTIPITRVGTGEDVYDLTDSHHNDKLLKDMAESLKGSKGMPVGVQICTKPYEDEKCLAMMKALERQINFHEWVKA